MTMPDQRKQGEKGPKRLTAGKCGKVRRNCSPRFPRTFPHLDENTKIAANPQADAISPRFRTSRTYPGRN